VNGRLVDLPDQDVLLGKLLRGQMVETEIQVPPADCKIQVVAVNRHDKSAPGTAHLTWRGPKVSQPETKPKLYLVAVGVSNYSNNEKLNLDFPADDARDFARAMEGQKGKRYADVVAKVLTDGGVTRETLIEHLQWLRKQVTPDDYGMVFLSGHGRNIETGRYYFLPNNANEENLSVKGLSADDIHNEMLLVKGNAIVFVDTCRKGKVSPGFRSFTSDITGLINKLLTTPGNLHIFWATSRGQEAQEIPALGHGVFTWALLDGIEQGKAANPSGEITVERLVVHLTECAEQLVPGGQQTPDHQHTGIPNFSIATTR
jgi:uncharacterized caspase-like protein